MNLHPFLNTGAPPASNQSNLAGLQTPDLLGYIDVGLFGAGANRSPAATTDEQGRTILASDSKRTRESNPFKTSFESLMSGKGAGKGAAASGGRTTATAAKAKSGARAGNGAVSSEDTAGAGAAAGGKLEKKKRKRSAGADGTEDEDDRLTSKRDRNRLAAKNCRQRKIDKENSLRVELEELQAKHAQLLGRFNKLAGEVKDLQK